MTTGQIRRELMAGLVTALMVGAAPEMAYAIIHHRRGQLLRPSEIPVVSHGEIGHDELDRYLGRPICTEPGQQPGHGGGRD
jgi:hypothetical protein